MSTRTLVILGLAVLAVALLGSILVIVLLRPPPAPVQPVRVGPTPLPASLSAQLPAGEVALVVRLTPVAGAGRFIRPGDRVDVLAFFSAERAGGQAITRTLMRDRVVLQTGRETDAPAVTLAATPEEAVLLQQAEQFGASPFVILRSSQGQPSSVSQDVVTDQDVMAWIRQRAREGPGSAR